MDNFKFENQEEVKIDLAHAYLILGLIVSQKPSSILELGLGGGRSADSILAGTKFNKNNPKFKIVDNWFDWNYNPPRDLINAYKDKAEIITMNEKDFIFSTKEKFDFIMSDADHNNTNKWFEYVYDNLLNDRGILVYHDINLIENSFINLREIYEICKKRNIDHYLFNKNSLSDERCQRGLLVIFKN